MHSKENSNNNQGGERIPRPDWLKIRPSGGHNFSQLKVMLRNKGLHTVCEEARCPNMNECWNSGTATFLIMGEICTRNCRFCAIKSNKPEPLDTEEPLRVALSVNSMKIRHAVITSVNRDDLPDGGSAHWAETIRQVRLLNPEITIEVLIPDFCGNLNDLRVVLDAKPDILNHNIETVPSLYPAIRPKAKYQTSLDILDYSYMSGFRVKSGIMVGLGETKEEVVQTMKDMRRHNVSIITIGQYLQPTRHHARVMRYVQLSEFDEYRAIGREIGFEHVESGPLVRSSYHAGNHV
jgi:lipoic acid synthetase